MSADLEPNPPLRLRAFLLGDADPAEALGSRFHKGSLRDVGEELGLRTKAEFQVVRRGLGKALGELLELDLVDVLVSAWSQLDKLAEAARNSVSSGAPQTVVLLTHTVRSQHNPSVDVLVDGVKKTAFRFEFGLQFDLKGVVATLRAGRLVAFDVAACDVKAQVSCAGQKLLERSGKLLLPRTVTLPRGGIPLARAPERAAEAEVPPQLRH